MYSLDQITAAIDKAQAAGDSQSVMELTRYADNLRMEQNQRDLEAIQNRKIVPERTFGGYFKEVPKAIGRGLVNTASTAGAGISALLPESWEKAARDEIKKIAGIANESIAPREGYEDTITTKLSEGIGSTVPFLMAGPFGMAGRVASGALALGAGAGEARERAEQEGANTGQRAKATALGALTGLPDMAMAEVGTLTRVFGKELGAVQSLLTTAAARGGVEGATEAAQKIAQNAIAKGLYKPEQSLLAESGEEGAYGAGVGALTSLLLDMTLGRRARGHALQQQRDRVEGPERERAAAEKARQDLMIADQQRQAAEQEGIASLLRGTQGVNESRLMQLEDEENQPGIDTTPQPMPGKPKPPAPEVIVDPAEAEQDELTSLFTTRPTTSAVEEKPATPTSEAVKPEETTEPKTLETPTGESAAQTIQDRIAALKDSAGNPPPVGSNERVVYDTLVQEQQKITPATPTEEKVTPVTPTEEKVTPATLTETKVTPATPTETKATPSELTAPAETTPAPMATTETTGEVADQKNPEHFTRMKAEGRKHLDNMLELAGNTASRSKPIQEAIAMWDAVTPNMSNAEAGKILINLGSALNNVKTENTKNLAPARDNFSNTINDFKRGVFAARNTIPVVKAKATSVPGASEKIEHLMPKTSEAKEQPTVSKKEELETVIRIWKNKLKTAKKDSKARVEMESNLAVAEKNLDKLMSEEQGSSKRRDNINDVRKWLVRSIRNLSGGRAIVGETVPEMIARTQHEYENADVDETTKEVLEPSVQSQIEEILGYEPGSTKWGGISKLRKLLDLVNGEAADLGMEPMKVSDNRISSLVKDNPALVTPLHKSVVEQLQANDLAGALRELSKRTQGKMSAIARMLSAAAHNANVEIIIADFRDSKVPHVLDKALRQNPNTADLSGIAFTAVGGKQYIALNSGMVTGMDNWTLLHEAHHILLDSVLDNTSHPLTKQLQGLFDDIRTQLGTAYGSTNLKEFMAEARSNPQFRETLGSIQYKNTALSAWDRFKLTVGNFLRKMLGAKQIDVDNALTHADTIIDAIVVGPDGMYSSLVANDFSQQGGAVLDAVADKIAKWPGMNEQRASAIHDIIASRIPKFVRRTILGSLPGHAVADLAQQEVPMAKDIYATIDQLSAAENERYKKLMAIADRASAWAARTDEKTVDKLFNVVGISTTNSVDPSKSRETYSKFWAREELPNQKSRMVSFDTKEERNAFVKANKNATKSQNADDESAAVWDRMQEDWRGIGEEGRSIYKQMRDAYAKQLRDSMDLMFKQIDDMSTDKTHAENIKNKVAEQIFKKGRIDPYFPLWRHGDYWLRFDVQETNPDTGNAELVEHVHAFDTDRERTQFITEMTSNGGFNFNKYARASDIQFHARPNTAFVREVLNLMQTNKVDQGAIDQFINLVVSTLPETAYARSFITRKNVPGFERDAIKVFRNKAHVMARQMANMEYSPKLYALRREMFQYVSDKHDNESAQLYRDELDASIEFALNPTSAALAAPFRAATFGMTLGGNISSAVADLMQTPMVTFPYLSKYGATEAMNAIGRATRIFTNSGTTYSAEMLVPAKGDSGAVTQTHTKARSMPSVDNIDFTDPKSAKVKHLETLVEVARANGQLNRTQLYEGLSGYDDVSSINMSAGMRRAIKDNGVLPFVNAVSGFLFHHSGRMNRQVALVAGYELELRRLMDMHADTKGKDLTKATKEQMEKAAAEAVKTAEMTQGGASISTAPRFARSNVGSLLFMFKRYGISMYYLQFKQLSQVLGQKRPENMSADEWKMAKTAAKRQLVGTMFAAGLFSGAQGLPFVGAIAMLYNLFLRGEDDDTAEQAARKYLNEGVYSGALNALTGSEWASRIGLSNLMFRTPKDTDPAHSSLTQQFGETFGGPVLGMAERFRRGLNLLENGHAERGIEQMVPVAIANAMKAYRFGTEGATTIRGDSISEVSAFQVAMQGIGFAPADYVRQLEMNADYKSFERDVMQRKSDLLSKYYVAWSSGDADGMTRITEAMAKFSEKHPSIAITGKTVQDSIRMHQRTTQNMIGGVTVNKKLRNEALEMQEAYGSNGIIWK